MKEQMSVKNERPITKQLIKLIESKGLLKIEASDVVKRHSDGSITVKMPMDQILAWRLLEFTASDDPKTAKKAAELMFQYVSNFKSNPLK